MSARVALAGLLAAAAPLAASGSEPASPPDAAALLERARLVQEADLAAWRRYRFVRTERLERLDGTGAVSSAEELVFVVTPEPGGGFDERLVKLDGREPTSREIERHRREARFSRRYAALGLEEPAEGAEAGLFTLRDFLRMPRTRASGPETLEGTPCHRLRFEPAPEGEQTGDEGERGGLAGRIASAMAGTLWITAEGGHVLRGEASTVRRVPIVGPLAGATGVAVSVHSAPVPAEGPGERTWLPRRITIETRVQILWGEIRRRNVFLYGEFEALSAEPL